MLAYLVGIFSVACASYVIVLSGSVLYFYAKRFRRGPLPKHVTMISASHLMLTALTSIATAIEPHGRTIPLEIRLPVIFVANVLTALSLKRVYKHRQSQQDTIDNFQRSL